MKEGKYNYGTKSIHVSEDIHNYLKIMSYHSRKTLGKILEEACLDYISKNKQFLRMEEERYINL